MAMHLDKTFDHRLAWLAGIIDGEGCIGFYLIPAYGKPRHRSDQAHWTIDIANTDSAMLAEVLAIAAVLGVKAKYCHKAARIKGRKPQGRVSFCSKQACVALLTSVYPYLVTKRAHADLMLRAIAHRRSWTGGQDLPRPDKHPGWVPAQLDEGFKALLAEIRILNKRGNAPVED